MDTQPADRSDDSGHMVLIDAEVPSRPEPLSPELEPATVASTEARLAPPSQTNGNEGDGVVNGSRASYDSPLHTVT